MTRLAIFAICFAPALMLIAAFWPLNHHIDPRPEIPKARRRGAF